MKENSLFLDLGATLRMIISSSIKKCDADADQDSWEGEYLFTVVGNLNWYSD